MKMLKLFVSDLAGIAGAIALAIGLLHLISIQDVSDHHIIKLFAMKLNNIPSWWKNLKNNELMKVKVKLLLGKRRGNSLKKEFLLDNY